MRRGPRLLLAGVAALSLLAAACGDEGDGGTAGTPGAAAPCTAQRLLQGAESALGTPRLSMKLAAAKQVAQAKPTVKIGFFGDLTGANSSLVIHSRDAAALAFKQANDSGKLMVNVQFVPRDNKDANPDTAPSIEQGFIQDREVVGVMGGAFSGETRAVGALFENAGLVHVSQSATGVDLTKQGWPFFRVLPNDDVQGPQAAELIQKLGCKRVAVVDDKSEYGAGLAKVVAQKLEAAGVEIVLREGIEPTTDYTTLIDSLLARNPDAYFYGGYDSEASLIVKQAKDKGLRALFVSGDGSKGDKLLQQGGAAAEGAVVACPCLDPNVSEEENARQFASQFRQSYNRAAGIYAAEGWDAAQVFIAAIDAVDDDGNVTRQEVLRAVPNVEIQGITKPIKFTNIGEVQDETIFAYIVEGGSFKLIGPIRQLSL